MGRLESNLTRTKRELDRLPEDLANGSLAGAALTMARMLDHPKTSATSKSMCAGKLQELVRELHSLAPPVEEADWLDDLAKRRSLRVAGGAAA
jgi:hypothetical protein